MRRVSQLTSAAAAIAMLAVASAATGTEDAGTPAPTANSSTGQARTVTLVTGDRVIVDQAPGGQHAVTVVPAEYRVDEPSFESVGRDGDVYVIPSDAAPLVPDVLDLELFNVTKLAEYGYESGLPVIVARDASTARHPQGAPPGMAATATLSSIDAIAATIDPSGQWWQAARSETARSRSTGPLAGVERVWLDELLEVTLNESVPQIGAPQAWAAGYDGSGVTVAVLDTGIDADHPDLDGKIVDAENFTAEPDVTDLHGHGTHVAGTVAGSGAASGGTYTGVAPGAELLVGKVCNGSGGCPTSSVMAGMQWAAAAGADVISMSLGGSPTDGTDPLSQAVNTLTAQHDALFVIAAGNFGAADYTVAAPAAADAALAVGAVDESDELAGFSSRGPRLGDAAIKPDVTAPGVRIAAARAEGTSMPGAVHIDEHYTQVSGTSMATPHVAGAAAILLQRAPDLTAGEAKAALATTAAPHDAGDVYQQGGGRIDVPAALEAPVRATPAPLDLGTFEYPQDDTPPESAEVTYTNPTDEQVVLDLSLEVEARGGGVPPATMLTLAPATLTIEPGGSARATVTLDVSQGELGLYGGYVIGESGGEVVVRTPVGFYKEPERFDLTVVGIGRDGDTPHGLSSVNVIDAHDTRSFAAQLVRLRNGVATFRVPPSTYSVMGFVRTSEDLSVFAQDVVMVGDPEVEVTEDTTVVLDARESTRLTVETPEHETAPMGGSHTIGYARAGEAFGSIFNTFTGPAHPPHYAAPTEPVTLGEFEFYTRTRLGAPSLVLQAVEPVDLDLHPLLMIGSPTVRGDHTLPLVYAGLGRPEDYQGIDAEGAVVLARRGGISAADKQVNAVAAGAAALLVANIVPGQFSESAGFADIPSMSLPMADGDDLVALVDEHGQGNVTLRLHGDPATPYVYDLVYPEADRIPADLHYVADPAGLATVHNRFYGDVAGHEMGEVRPFVRPWAGGPPANFDRAYVGTARIEYVVPGDTHYRQQLYGEWPARGPMYEPWTFYEAGEHREQTWFKRPAAPGVHEGGPHESGVPVVRVQDTLQLDLPAWGDAHPGHYGPAYSANDTTAFRFFRNGALVAERASASGSFPMSPEPAEYRLELDVTRDAPWWNTSMQTHTAWTLQSQRSPGGAPRVVPLLLVDYDVDVDLLNTAPHPRDRGRPAVVELQVRHQAGAEGAAIAGARAWVSYDDGETWRARPTRHRGDGRFEVILDSRDPDETTGFVSLRVEAWDADANRIAQEITRAWRLPDR